MIVSKKRSSICVTMHLCSIEMLLFLFVLLCNGKNGALANRGELTKWYCLYTSFRKTWNYKSLQLKLHCRHRHSPGGFHSKSEAPLGAVAIRDIWTKMFRDTGYLDIEKNEFGILSKKFWIQGYAIKETWDIKARNV